MYNNLLKSQLESWEMARDNYEALSNVRIKALQVDDCIFQVQFNPARIISSGAKVDAKSIWERKCFLCAENRPDVQKGILFDPKSNDNSTLQDVENDTISPLGDIKEGLGAYTILVNPFPIFSKHFTIPANEHYPQLIVSRFSDMLELAETMSDSVIFYNGPKCGASAPDHIHFQAGNKGFLPIEMTWQKHQGEVICESSAAKISAFHYIYPAFLIEAETITAGVEAFEQIYDVFEIKQGEEEPMLNILCWEETGKWISIIIPRTQHRPARYFAEGEENMLISPASVDLGGVFITPLEKDFEKICAEDIKEVLNQICLSEDKFTELMIKLAEK